MQVLECALVGKRLVNIRVVERGRIVHLHVDIIVRNELRARVLAKVVRHQVMRNAGNPRVEAVVGRVFPLANLEYSLHERILKEVVRKVSILLSHKENIGVESVLVARNKYIESLVLAFHIKRHQTIIIVLIEKIHYV